MTAVAVAVVVVGLEKRSGSETARRVTAVAEDSASDRITRYLAAIEQGERG